MAHFRCYSQKYDKNHFYKNYSKTEIRDYLPGFDTIVNNRHIYICFYSPNLKMAKTKTRKT